METHSSEGDNINLSKLNNDDLEGEDETEYFDAVFSKVKTQCHIERLEDLDWYHGDMTRNTAEVLLLANGLEGSYLLRNSHLSKGLYAVSVRCKDSIKHYSLEMAGCGGTYRFGMGEFDSLKELLEHFECKPVLGNLSGVSVTLKYPYSNHVPEPSTYERVICHSEEGRKFTKGSSSTMDEKQLDLHIASKEGYLVKRGAIRKNWKKRWFLIQKNHLIYFENHKSTNPRRVIDLNDAISMDEEMCVNKPNCFKLVLPERTFYFEASSYNERKSWMEILQWKIDYYRKRKASLQNAEAPSSFISFPKPKK